MGSVTRCRGHGGHGSSTAGNVLATPAVRVHGHDPRRGPIRGHRCRSTTSCRRTSGTSRHNRDVWLSFQKTKGSSDLYVQSNVWAPGGSTGWHTHPGHSLIIVTAGTVTAYDGDDAECQPARLHAGNGVRRSRRRPCAQPPERRRSGGADGRRSAHPGRCGRAALTLQTRDTARSDEDRPREQPLQRKSHAGFNQRAETHSGTQQKHGRLALP